MNSLRKFRKNCKALSPIFATLILIAIAVIAGIVVYMFTSGTIATMTGGGTAGQEKVAIQAIEAKAGAAGAASVKIYAQSVGGPSVILDSVIIKDSIGTVSEVVASSATIGTTLGSPVSITPTKAMVAGDVYTVTLVSKAGGNFVSQSFKVAA